MARAAVAGWFFSNRGRAVSASVPLAPITVVAANGWTGTYPSVPTGPVLETAFTVVRAGFNASAGTTTYSDEILITRRLRVAGTVSDLDADGVGFSEYVFAADTIPGRTNSSAEVSPKPVCQWLGHDAEVVANSVSVGLSAEHILGIACVVFRATDGTTTVETTVSIPTVAGDGMDQGAVIGYFGTLNISTLASGPIRVNARVFPRVGVAASVADSGLDGAAWWKFADRWYLKDALRITQAWRCYVDVAAVDDTTGRWETLANDASAQANPFKTYQGAMGAHANATRGIRVAGDAADTQYAVDGATIFLRAGTHNMASPVSGTNKVKGARLKVTRDPGAARNTVIANSSVGWGPRLPGTGTSLYSGVTAGTLLYEDVRFERSANVSITTGSASGAPLRVQVRNVDQSGGGFAASLVSSSPLVMMDVFGSAMTGMTGSALASNVLFRGFTLTASGIDLFGWSLHGGTAFGVISLMPSGVDMSGYYVQGCKFLSRTSANPLFLYGGTTNVTGGVRINNVIEHIGTITGPAARMSGDAETGNLTHCFERHETFAGFDLIARHNDRYVDTDATGTRVHKFCSVKASIIVQYNSKHDRFLPLNAARVGGWPVAFGVGYDSNLILFQNASGSLPGFAADYAGKNSLVGTSNTVGIDPLWTTPRQTISGPTAGAGNGVYSIGGASPAKGRVPVRLTPFDITGAARPATNDAAGAYS